MKGEYSEVNGERLRGSQRGSNERKSLWRLSCCKQAVENRKVWWKTIIIAEQKAMYHRLGVMQNLWQFQRNFKKTFPAVSMERNCLAGSKRQAKVISRLIHSRARMHKLAESRIGQTRNVAFDENCRALINTFRQRSSLESLQAPRNQSTNVRRYVSVF